MKKIELVEMLKELHEDLERRKTIDEQSKELLKNIADDIDKLLEKDSEPELLSSIKTNVDRSLEDFSEKHPSVSSVIGKIADKLNEIGI